MLAALNSAAATLLPHLAHHEGCIDGCARLHGCAAAGSAVSGWLRDGCAAASEVKHSDLNGRQMRS